MFWHNSTWLHQSNLVPQDHDQLAQPKFRIDKQNMHEVGIAFDEGEEFQP